jgi:hypothetical protein
LRFSGGFGSTTTCPSAPTVLRTKKFRASKASSRRYSNAVPCSALVPDLVETEMTPAPRPNSAEKTPVNTLNSRTCSTDGEMITVLKEYSLLSMPSMSHALALA